MKACIKCNENKPKTDFYKHSRSKDGLAGKCKVCEREYQREKYPQFKEKQRNYKKEWDNNNPDKVLEYQKTYNKKHPKKHPKTYNKKSLNPNYQREYQKYRYHNDTEYKLIVNLRNRVNQYLIKGNHEKTIDFLGCSINEWKVYLEQKFDENMNWDNYGKGGYWEIDHIIPLSKGGTFHYTNTQPLTIIQNRKKSDKLD